MTRQLSAVAGLAVALLITGCGGKHTATPPAASPSASASASDSSSPGLGGGSGEQSSAPRSTVITTPTPTLSNQSGVAEADGDCPYISAQDWANAEGDRVGRVTVLQTKPIGCRFYFQYDPNVIVGEIRIYTFATSTKAYNAMVLSAKGHSEVQTEHIGDDAVAFRAELQGNQTWQCVFAKGTRVVTVHTRQHDPALNAFNLARQIAPSIH